ncbi:hypothetical protein LX32DRAFT_703021 [Colletotrichum zoysiae]|uniref:Uncharacterized protein n=1 Tax=Colletotrichum zoysiae TaxID=1216348 RepID=A0AAD9HC32_9PEZI|nr:hypothetical protein LX32DRAFT_703021 [Colletotrichum zoysiae]
MSRGTEPQGSLSEQESSSQKGRKPSKTEKKRLKRRLKNKAKRAAENPTTEPPDGRPEIAKQEQPVVKQEQLDLPADIDTALNYNSESEWEGFPDPPAPATHITPAVPEAGAGSSVVANETPAIEGKAGINALQQSIASQFPGNPRPATHTLLDLLEGPMLRGLAAPSQPGNHTVDQLALATRLWFAQYRDKQVRLGVVRKNKDPIVDIAGSRRNGILWIRIMDGNPSQPDQKPTKFCGMSVVPAEIRLYEKEYAKTESGKH